MCRGSYKMIVIALAVLRQTSPRTTSPLVGELHAEDPAAAHPLDSEPVEGVVDCLLQNDAARMAAWLRYGPPNRVVEPGGAAGDSSAAR